jgi:two-component system, chemotaxis family, protein-glutamate methylesterase/glutaminase
VTSPRRVRVLVVDDSAFARKVMREVLQADPRIDVVAIARDGLDALEKIVELTPDVVTLDLVMPQLDGVGVLDAIRMLPSPPRVVVVTMSDAESVLGVAALQAGAFDVVHKPTALATDRLYELGAELVQKVLLAAAALAGTRSPSVDAHGTPIPRSDIPLETPHATRMVLVGASTGGPRAITQLLRALPESFPVPVGVVVHMPAGYTEAFASRLDRECSLEVVEAKDGTVFRAGVVVIARAGIHMKIRKANDGWTVALDVHPLDSLHRPSVDALFESAVAAQVGDGVLGVVLTGMGSDGLEGARAIRAAGGRVVVEHASTCVVYGMPRAISEQGLANAEVPMHEMAEAIIARL